MQVLSYIAPPSAVFECTLPYYTTSNASLTRRQKFEMDSLVNQIISDFCASNCSSYLFHCFSNGGCFVWEAFRRATPTQPAALIMDSCPGFQIHRITMAMDYCTWQERLQVAWRHGRYFWRAHNHSLWQPQVQARADAYMYNLRDDPWYTPQLFLYSHDDPLMPFQEVAGLARARKERGVPVYEKVWEQSRHCAHLIDHPDDYEQAVGLFLEHYLPTKTLQRAKL
jgi:pimeloyl-ACP methyl ester carboxylesterase